MNEHPLTHILEQLAEEGVPDDLDLRIGIHRRLEKGKAFPYKGANPMKTSFSQPRRLAALSVIAIALLVVALLFTPQGRILAQSVLQFFTQAESNSFPLLPHQITSNQPDTSAPTAEPPAPLISVSDAEAQVGFDAAELSFIPDGFDYLGARLYGNAIHIEYQTPDKGGHLVIKQSQEGFDQSEWDKVPPDAVAPVKIGELDGEFTQGTFVVYPNQTSATWNPNAAILRLRWEKDGIWFELVKFGNVEAIEYLDQEKMVELAESLTIKP